MPGPSGPPSNKRVARNKKTLILCLYLMSFEATRTSSAPAIPLRTSGQDRLSELARPHGCCVRKRSTDGTDSVWCDRQPLLPHITEILLSLTASTAYRWLPTAATTHLRAVEIHQMSFGFWFEAGQILITQQLVCVEVSCRNMHTVQGGQTMWLYIYIYVCKYM